MLASWIDGYRPSYEETYWYGLAPIVEQVERTVGSVRDLGVSGFAGGEVAADRLRPWRVPTEALVYCDELLDLTYDDLVPANADDATLTLRVSGDTTLSATARWWWNEMGRSAFTVDPVNALWDLRTGRRDPGDGAIEELHDWI